MKQVLARLLRRRPVRSRKTAGERSGSEGPLVSVQVRAGERPVAMTLDEVGECGTADELLRRAEARSAARPDPADFAGRPIGDLLKALGVPEDTSRYEREEGVTTLVFRLGRGRRGGEDVRDRGDGTTPEP